MIVKGDKSNLAQECGVKAFQQGVRNKEFRQNQFDTVNVQIKYVTHTLRHFDFLEHYWQIIRNIFLEITHS